MFGFGSDIAQLLHSLYDISMRKLHVKLAKSHFIFKKF